MPKKILLTGPVRCGKTTAVIRILSGLAPGARGFYTEEVLGPEGGRIGFDVVTLGGLRGPLARLRAPGQRVGRYGVCLEFLENRALREVAGSGGNLAVIDEIGKMECLSERFIGTVRSLLEGEAPVLATVALGGAPFIREVRQRPDVELIEVTPKNREGLVLELTDRFRA